ncbi:DDE-type integrase/transposase/recombinase, partial [Roseomonas mucosa]|uniref:Mu transposase C-terminal domain-containing protein n=1 Tax=Roseomonas mucosa TaxID=207340 RepID=UPI0028CF3375
MLAYRGRAQDRLRQHLFVDEENVPEHMTDKEFVDHLTNEVLRPTTPEELDRERQGRAPKRIALASSADMEEVSRRSAYVQAWTKAGRPSQSRRGLDNLIGPVAERLGDKSPPSWRTLARWIRVWLLWGEDVEALLPEKGGNRKDRFEGQARQLLTDTVTEHYCVDTRPEATVVHRAVERAFEKENEGLPMEAHLPIPSYQAVLDEIAGIDRFTLEYARTGKRSAEHKFRPVQGGPVVRRHNQAWEIDHTTVDAVVVEDETEMPIGRARVSVCLDRGTTYCTSMTMGFEPPSAAVALECLAVGVTPKDKLLATVPGIGTWPCFSAPDEIVSDQGGDFRSEAFRDCCLIIGTDVEYSPVLKAWYRGRIERFFRTLTRGVFQRVPGTTFSNFFLRNKEAIPESVAVCTLSELWNLTLRYIVDVYNRKPRRALGGKSAEQLWNESVQLHGMKPPPSPRQLRLATSLPMQRTLQRYGVEILGLIYQSPELALLRVRQDCPRLIKVLTDPQDLTRIRIIHP